MTPEIFDVNEFIAPLFDRLRVAVIYGGNKDVEDAVLYRTRSSRGTKTYEAVANDIADSLKRLGFRHVTLYPEDMRLPDRLRRDNVQLAWLNSGGVQGYNPMAHLPSLMEMMGLPYVGHNPLNATVLDNKHTFKRELRETGLPTAPFLSWDMARGLLIPEINSCFKAAFGAYRGPFIVKPVSGRASVHVHYVEAIEELQGAVADVARVAQNIVLIEKYLPGREFAVAVSGPVVARRRDLRKCDSPFAFSVCERVLSTGEAIFTSMDKAPITTDRVRPVDLTTDPDIHTQLTLLAQRTFLHFNLETLVRLDVRADENGNMFVLEANPKPDLARPRDNKLSLVCAGLSAEGMDYEDLILSLIVGRLVYLATQRRDSVRHILDLAFLETA